MSDDTTTGTSGSQVPINTTSVTETIGRPPRKLYFFLQAFVLAATVGVCWIHRGMQDSVDSMEMKDISQITKLVFRLGHLLTNPLGMACAIFVVVGLGLLAIKGALDGILKFLIWLNVLWLLAFVVYSTANIWMPLLKARKELGG